MPSGIEKDRALQTFYLRMAVLYADPSARIPTFAQMIDVNYETFKSYMQGRCRPSQKAREGICRILGPEFVPPEIPDRRFKENW